MILDGNMVIALIVLLVVVWLVFYIIPTPPPVKMGLGIVCAVALVLWALVLMGLVRF